MIENIPAPPPFAAYADAVNSHNTAAIHTCFTADAVVNDEGHEYRGLEAIRQWCIQSFSQYQFTIGITQVSKVGEETVVTASVAGTFDGSPVTLRFFMTLSGNKIATLNIGA